LPTDYNNMCVFVFDFQQEIDVADMNYEEAKLANRPETDI